MVAYYYNDQLGNTSSSDGTNDFLLSGTLTNFNSLNTLLNKYVPYYIQHDSASEWEYGLGYIYNNGSQDILIRGGNGSYPFTVIYSSSNSNSKVNFSAGTKSIKAIISAEKINHGGNNYATITNSNFTADTVQTIYGVLASGVGVTGQLPSASGNKNLVLGFRILPGSTNSVVITGVAGQTIDGSLSSISLSTDDKYTSLISNGSGWYQLNRSVNVESAGLPSGDIGSIQFKQSSTTFNGVSDLFWDNTSGNLLIGGNTTGTANIILPSDSGHNILFNNQAYNIDFQIKGTGTTNQLFFDASAGRLGINTNSPSTILHIIGKCANDTMKLESTTACSTGVALTLFHNPSTGSDIGDYPATINLAGRNSNAEQTNFAQIRSKILGTGINATSGELIINVDYSGIPTTTLTTNPKRICIGLSGIADNKDNILIGNFINISGYDSIVVGQNSAVSGASSSGNILIGNNSDILGTGNIVSSTNSLVAGNNIMIGGPANNISGSYIIGYMTNSNISGNYIIVNGFNNNLSGNYNSLFGSNNTVSSSISGIILGDTNTITNVKGFAIGESNTVNGTGLGVIGTTNSASGTNNIVVGKLTSVTGSGNYIVGDLNNITATGNIIIGNDIYVTGTNNVLIGSNIDNSISNHIVMGVNSNQLIVGTSGVVLNSGLSATDTIIYGSSALSGIFIRNNKVGINNIPSDYTLQVSGSISGISAHVDSLRIGSTSTSGYILKTDASGNASWTSLSSIQGNLTNGLLSNSLVVFNGTELSSTTGIYWNSSSGVIYTDNSNHILPTGNNTFTINNSKHLLSKIFNIKGSGTDNLFVVNSQNNMVGINIAPTYNLHVSGTLRSTTSSYYFIENNNNEFIVAYDIGPSTFNRIKVTSSGTFIRNNGASPILPEHVSFTSSTSLATASGLCTVVYDTATEQLLYRNNIIAGFGTFTGSADT